MTETEEAEDAKVVRHGGMAFYMAYLLCMFGSCLSLSCITAFWAEEFLTTLQSVVTGVLFGVIAGAILIRGYVKALVHEVKHLLVAVLVGNKIEGFRLGDGEGHVTYAYTSDKRKFNAVIAIAPYVLPFFSLPVFVCLQFASGLEPKHSILILCLAFGFDLYANFRDVSPIQTDFTGLKGGFLVGATFTVFANLFYSSCGEGSSACTGRVAVCNFDLKRKLPVGVIRAQLRAATEF